MLNFYNPVNVRKPTFFQRFQGGEGGGGIEMEHSAKS